MAPVDPPSGAPRVPLGDASAPPPRARILRGVPLGSAPEGVASQLEEAHTLMTLSGNLSGSPPALSPEDQELRSALLNPTYNLTSGIYGGFVELVSRHRTGPELKGLLGFTPVTATLPTGDTATLDLPALAGPAELPPPFIYLPASAADIQAIASGNVGRLQIRDIEGVAHVAVRVPALSVPQMDELARLVPPGDPTPADVLVPRGLSGTPPPVVPGHRARAAELQAGPLIDVFGSDHFGYRVLNTMNALRLALEKLETLGLVRDLAATADPASKVANALLLQALQRTDIARAEAHREWEASLRDLDSATLAAYRGFVERTRAVLAQEFRNCTLLEVQLDDATTRWAEAERVATEAKARVTDLEQQLDSANQKSRTLEAQRDEARAQLAAQSLQPPPDSVPRTQYEQAVASEAREAARLEEENESLKTELQRLQLVVDPERMFRYFQSRASPGVVGEPGAFLDHLRGYFNSEHVSYAIQLMVCRSSVTPDPSAFSFQDTQGGPGSVLAPRAGSRGRPSGPASGTSELSSSPVASASSASAPRAPASALAVSGNSRVVASPGASARPGTSPATAAQLPRAPEASGPSPGRELPKSRAQGPDIPPEGSALDFDMGNGSGDSDDDDDLRPPRHRSLVPRDDGDEENDEGPEEIAEQRLLPRMTSDGLRQIRPRDYEPQEDPHSLWYHAIDSDADPPRTDRALLPLLPVKASFDDVRLDVLEYLRMDGRCSLQEAEDAIMNELEEDMVVHSCLREDVLIEILRRALCLQILDEVDWLRHVPEEYFDRGVAQAEKCGWDVGVERPWPQIPTERPDSPEHSDGDEDASEDEPEPGASRPRSTLKRKRSQGPSVSESDPSPLISPSGKRSRRMKASVDCTSDVSTDDERRPTRRERLVQTADMGPEDAHTPTRVTMSWVVYEIRVCAASDSVDRQTRGFPDIKCVAKEAKKAQARFRADDYDNFVNGSVPGEVMPWDIMFTERVKIFWFFTGPISSGLQAVLEAYVTHMFVWRRAHWERLHWIEMNRDDSAHQALYSARRELQKAWSKARIGLKTAIKQLPEPERKIFRIEPGLWRRPRKVAVWVPMDPSTRRSLPEQVRILDTREPSRVYWGLPGTEDRVPESASPGTWRSRITDPAQRHALPDPRDADSLPIQL